MPSLTYAKLAQALKIALGRANTARVTIPDETVVCQDSHPDSPGNSPTDVPGDNPVHLLQAQIASRLESAFPSNELLAAERDAARRDWTVNREASLAAASGRPGDFAARLLAQDAETEVEQAKTDKAIAAFANLTERLDALAAERTGPWWKRLVG